LIRVAGFRNKPFAMPFPKALIANTMEWSDLMKIEAVPVIETVDLMKVAKKGKGSKK